MVVAAIGAIGAAAKRFFLRGRRNASGSSQSGPSHVATTASGRGTRAATATPGIAASPVQSVPRQRRDIRILFVDDDKSFQVTKIMKAAGWPNVSIRRDVKDLDDVRDVDVFFIDIHGVGRALGFADEGLGLSLAIKKKYPDKKVVIYSAQTDGDRFHKALQEADASLAKNAEPYQFIQLLESLTEHERHT
jgi:hypothetical protein